MSCAASARGREPGEPRAQDDDTREHGRDSLAADQQGDGLAHAGPGREAIGLWSVGSHG